MKEVRARQIFGKEPSRQEKHLGQIGNHTKETSAIMELLSEVKDEINYIGLLTDLIYG